MDAEVVRRRLLELERFLEQHGVKYATEVAALRQRIEKVQATDLPRSERERVRALFGGMSSLNDVVISRASGHIVDDEAAANLELDRLTQDLWQSVETTG